MAFQPIALLGDINVFGANWKARWNRGELSAKRLGELS